MTGVRANSSLPEAGQHSFTADVVRLLSNRLGIEAAIAENPEILAEDVSDPIVITGLPRTGTTKLHRALAADPGLQEGRALAGAVSRGAGRRQHRLRRRLPDRGHRRAGGVPARTDPELMAAYTLHTHAAEEDGLLLQHSFRTLNSGWVAHAYSFSSHGCVRLAPWATATVQAVLARFVTSA